MSMGLLLAVLSDSGGCFDDWKMGAGHFGFRFFRVVLVENVFDVIIDRPSSHRSEVACSPILGGFPSFETVPAHMFRRCIYSPNTAFFETRHLKFCVNLLFTED